MAKGKRAPTEIKVIAGGGGFAIGTQVSNAILWCLGVWFWSAPSSGPKSDTAATFVPQPWRELVIVFVPLLLGVAFAYLAPHTPRPDLLAPVEETPAVPTAPADLERHTEPIERLKVPDHEDHGVDLFRGA